MIDSRPSYKSPRMTYQEPSKQHWNGQGQQPEGQYPTGHNRSGQNMNELHMSSPNQGQAAPSNAYPPSQQAVPSGPQQYSTSYQQQNAGQVNPSYPGGYQQVNQGTGPYGSPIHNQYGAPKQERPNRFGFALTSFILSMINIFVFLGMFLVAGMADYESEAMDLLVGLFLLINVLFCTLSIVFGALTFRSSKGMGLGVTGFVLSILNVLSLVLLMIIGAMV